MDKTWVNTECYINRLRYEQDHVINMKHEKERLDTICDQEEAQIQKLKKVLDIVRMYVYPAI